jgi:poly(A) polymerase
MAAQSVKQWGLTPPISSALPIPADVALNSALIEELKRQNNYESPAETAKRCVAVSAKSILTFEANDEGYRQSTLQLLYQVTVEFVKEVCRRKGFSEPSLSEFGGKIFPFGSYRLGVYGPGQ